MTTIHLVSHTHWDREWYLTFEQFRLKLIHLIDHLLDILDRDPDFKFYLLDGQTIILEDYLEIRPERQDELVQNIKAGRILIGPWYVSPDEFLVSPESHIRNLLEGDKLCQLFGGKMQVGYLPDNFGHIGQMPQILQGFGINAASLWRGLDDHPCELNWISPDGSSVLLANLRDSYSNAASITAAIPEKFINDVNTLSLSLSLHSITDHTLLMHGTDHMEPVNDLSKAMGNYRVNGEQNDLLHSNLPLFFNEVRTHLISTGKQLPIVTGELRSSKCSALLQNILSTRISLKQRNRQCETDLLKWVEPLNAWTNLLNSSSPSVSVLKGETNGYKIQQDAIIRHAWKLLMQCHPHDSICGTSIDQVAAEMQIRFDQVDQINHELLDQSLQVICDHIDTRGVDFSKPQGVGRNILSAIVVFNPNDATQSGLVNLSIKLSHHFSSYEIIDIDGDVIECDFSGTGARELISLVLDKKALKQAFGMIHEGHVAGMVVRDFNIEQHTSHASIHATLSDHGNVNINRWREGVTQMDALLADPAVLEFHIHAYSDPEIKLSFVARDIPQQGYSCYWISGLVEPGKGISKPVKLNPILQRFLPVIARGAQLPIISKFLEGKKHHNATSPKRIENEFFIVEVLAKDGNLTITDKRTQQVYSGLNSLFDNGDCGDLYNYCPPERDLTFIPQINKIVHEDHNTYKKLVLYSTLILPSRLSDDRKSRSNDWVTNSIISTITLVTGIPRIDIHTQIDNRAHDHRLRVHFPAPFSTTDAMYDGHFEIVQRPIGIPQFDETWEEPPRPEVPQLQFTCVSNDRLSLTIANLGLPEVEVLKNKSGNSEIAITLLRCVGWLSRDDLTTRKSHAGPMEVTVPDAQMVGSYTFDYSIIPGDAQWREYVCHAFAFTAPLKLNATSVHPGTLPTIGAFIENTNKYFIITTIKTANDGSGLIVRGYNLLSTPIDTSLKFLIPVIDAQLVSLDEKLIAPIKISSGNAIDLHLDAHKIITIRLLY